MSKLYWSNSEVIEEFAEMKPEPYWQDFFSALSRVSQVLDLGCGAGRYMQMLAEMDFRVMGSDNSVQMIRRTWDRLTRLQLDRFGLVVAGMDAMPFADEAFDAILCNGVFHNATDERSLSMAFQESARILKHGGYLCLNMFTASHIDPSLTKTSSRNSWRTTDGAEMILIAPMEIITKLSACGVHILSQVSEYKRRLRTGTRSVFRAVFVRG